MTARLRIIRPSSRESQDLLTGNIPSIQHHGFTVLYDDLPIDPSWTYVAGSAPARAQALADALAETTSDFVICARGGYGASDLLELLPWESLKLLRPKLVIGFSDISAIHSALYTKLGWHGLHAPMPATSLWVHDPTQPSHDLEALFANLKSWQEIGTCSGSIPMVAVGTAATTRITGTLFGGCFTVLTNLIGTPYFPGDLRDHILFIEDTDEHPARLMRALNQWIQCGAFTGVKALVIGHLRNLGQAIPDCANFVLNEFAARLKVPVFHTPLLDTPNQTFH